jgi:outer membrane protein TolC
MKDLNVLKKLFLLCSLIGISHLTAQSDLENYLTQEKNLIFDYQEIKNQLEMDKLHDSWISPIMISYQENWTNQPLSGTQSSSAFSIGIDQPIFRSGGIYYAIKYSGALRGVNAQEIAIKKRELIGKAIDILYSIKKLKLQHQKLKLMARNDVIDIRRKQESYNAGILDSSFLDQAILKHNLDEAQMLDIELNLAKLRNGFRLLSRKNPDKLRTPRLRMISLKHYKNGNMDLAAKRLRTLEKEYNSKMTWAKYLPTVSVNARYTNTNRHAPGMDDDYSTYGFKISMPLNINSATDIESSRVSYMQSMTELQDSRRTIGLEYDIVRKSMHILNRKIALAKKDEALYRRLYTRTKDLVKAGEKTDQDSQTMLNSLKIKKLDRKIYAIEKQQQLLSLYIKVSH